MAGPQYVFVMKGLSKTYPGGKQVLKDIWLSFYPGAKIGIVGINGSGKHCNWSMAITADNALDGTNLLKPGKTPHQNIRFLIFLAAVLKGVHKHAGLLRAGIGTSGNEHRLGANEAPPAIISVFMGNMLTRLIEDIAAGKEAGKGAEQQLIKLGVAKLPEIEKDNTDRNRTSPFAFTGTQRWRGRSMSTAIVPS